MNAEEIFKLIKKGLSNEERIKLLNLLYDEYFNKRPPKNESEKEIIWDD